MTLKTDHLTYWEEENNKYIDKSVIEGIASHLYGKVVFIKHKTGLQRGRVCSKMDHYLNINTGSGPMGYRDNEFMAINVIEYSWDDLYQELKTYEIGDRVSFEGKGKGEYKINKIEDNSIELIGKNTRRIVGGDYSECEYPMRYIPEITTKQKSLYDAYGLSGKDIIENVILTNDMYLKYKGGIYRVMSFCDGKYLVLRDYYSLKTVVEVINSSQKTDIQYIKPREEGNETRLANKDVLNFNNNITMSNLQNLVMETYLTDEVKNKVANLILETQREISKNKNTIKKSSDKIVEAEELINKITRAYDNGDIETLDELIA